MWTAAACRYVMGRSAVANGRCFARVANLLVAGRVVEQQARGCVRPAAPDAPHVDPCGLDGIEQAQRQVRADDRDQAHMPTEPAGHHGGVGGRPPQHRADRPIRENGWSR